MRASLAYLKKELVESVRRGKLFIMTGIFLLLGIMNPAISKLTPLLFEMFGEALEGSGLIITDFTVNAITSWTQYYKNLPMAYIAFVLLFGNSFTKEYGESTLVLLLTKGLKRYKVIIAKLITLVLIFSIGYWLGYIVTYVSNDILWDNSIAPGALFCSFCSWLFGIFLISLIVLFSVLGKNYVTVLLSTGGVVFAFYILSIIPKLAEYLPLNLLNVSNFLMGNFNAEDFTKAIIVTVSLTVLAIAVSIPILNKKQI